MYLALILKEHTLCSKYNPTKTLHKEQPVKRFNHVSKGLKLILVKVQ